LKLSETARWRLANVGCWVLFSFVNIFNWMFCVFSFSTIPFLQILIPIKLSAFLTYNSSAGIQRSNSCSRISPLAISDAIFGLVFLRWHPVTQYLVSYSSAGILWRNIQSKIPPLADFGAIFRSKLVPAMCMEEYSGLNWFLQTCMEQYSVKIGSCRCAWSNIQSKLVLADVHGAIFGQKFLLLKFLFS